MCLFRPAGAPLVIRPDSGDPVEGVLQVLAKLEGIFGYTENTKGFKARLFKYFIINWNSNVSQILLQVLPPYIRVIQGDGVSYDSIKVILQTMQDRGWSAENITFGSGGALLQKLNR